jgi:hypothetical protein
MNLTGDPWSLPLDHKEGTSPDDPTHGVLIGQLSSTFFESLTIENTYISLELKSSRPVHNVQIQLTLKTGPHMLLSLSTACLP